MNERRTNSATARANDYLVFSLVLLMALASPIVAGRNICIRAQAAGDMSVPAHFVVCKHLAWPVYATLTASFALVFTIRYLNRRDDPRFQKPPSAPP
jgi:hypothetical protein